MNLTDSRRLHLLETFPKFVPAPVPEVSRQQNKICVVSIFLLMFRLMFVFWVFKTGTSHSRESNKWLQEHDQSVWVFLQPCPWDSGHSLVGVYSCFNSNWLPFLEMIWKSAVHYRCFFLFLFWVEKKMILHLTILVCIWWQYNRETESSSPLFCAMLCSRCTCNCTCTWN